MRRSAGRGGAGGLETPRDAFLAAGRRRRSDRSSGKTPALLRARARLTARCVQSVLHMLLIGAPPGRRARARECEVVSDERTCCPGTPLITPRAMREPGHERGVRDVCLQRRKHRVLATRYPNSASRGEWSAEVWWLQCPRPPLEYYVAYSARACCIRPEHARRWEHTSLPKATTSKYHVVPYCTIACSLPLLPVVHGCLLATTLDLRQCITVVRQQEMDAIRAAQYTAECNQRVAGAGSAALAARYPGMDGAAPVAAVLGNGESAPKRFRKRRASLCRD